jgi:hypothetical protein
MEIEATSEQIVARTPNVAPDAEGFGTRSSRSRPHSINLYGNGHDGSRDAASRGFDLLLGLGVGVAAMYYLDAEHGARRRDGVKELMRAVLGAFGSALSGGRADG